MLFIFYFGKVNIELSYAKDNSKKKNTNPRQPISHHIEERIARLEARMQRKRVDGDKSVPEDASKNPPCLLLPLSPLPQILLYNK